MGVVEARYFWLEVSDSHWEFIGWSGSPIIGYLLLEVSDIH